MEKRAFLVISLAAVLLSAGCNSPLEGTKIDADKTVDKTPPGGLADDVKGLFSGRPIEYMAEYESTIVVDNDQTKSMHAFYYRGDQMRTDMSNEVMETRFYSNKDEFISCTKQGGQWSCIKMQDAQSRPQEKDPTEDMESLKRDVADDKMTRLPERVIAGVNCKCFYQKINLNMPGAEDAGMSEIEATYCMSPEGIPLYTETKTKNMHRISEATKYSTRLSDADFAPPAEPKTMEELLGGGTQQDQQPPETLPADFKEQQCAVCDKMPTEESAQECRETFAC